MLIQKPQPNQQYLKPHEYPIWLILSVIIIIVIWGQLMSVLPKVWELHQSRKQMQDLIIKADSLYRNQNYKAAIPIYKKQYLIDKGIEPIRLSLCYFSLGDKESLYKGLALLGLGEVRISEKDKDINEIFNRVPDFFLNYLKTTKTEILNTQVTNYSFNFDKLKEENPKEFQRILAASKEFGERLKN
jgi:hypothetical protein